MLALFGDPAKGRYYVARKGDTILGCFMTTYEWSDWRNGTIHWLQSVYVGEDYRKQGVFKYMYDYLMERIRQDPDACGLRLYVDKSNQRAMRVYESMGMDGSHYTVYERMK
jgi:ribosomal protein S18 acetylase RimI-like enzyme